MDLTFVIFLSSWTQANSSLRPTFCKGQWRKITLFLEKPLMEVWGSKHLREESVCKHLRINPRGHRKLQSWCWQRCVCGLWDEHKAQSQSQSAHQLWVLHDTWAVSYGGWWWKSEWQEERHSFSLQHEVLAAVHLAVTQLSLGHYQPSSERKEICPPTTQKCSVKVSV